MLAGLASAGDAAAEVFAGNNIPVILLSEDAPTPLITHSMPRCDMLNPCVTAPGRSSTTSLIPAASGVSTWNAAP